MIAFTVDAEQWNCPLLEGRPSPEDGNTAFSRDGNALLLELFRAYGVRATFFVTGVFAEQEPDQVRLIRSQGHEIACHGYHHHWRGNARLDIRAEVVRSKEAVLRVTGERARGFRAPQLQYSETLVEILAAEGFAYDSSLHPTYLPGAYNHIARPVSVFRPKAGLDVTEIPLAVSPLKLPISWCFMRLLGVRRTIRCCERLMAKGVAPVLYVHSWEYTPIPDRNVPFYYTCRTGRRFLRDAETLIRAFGGASFTTTGELAARAASATVAP